MNTHNPGTDSPDDRDRALANELGLDIGQGTPKDTDGLLSTLADRDTDPVLLTLLEHLLEENTRLQDRFDELEATQDRTHDIATTASAKAETNASHLESVEDKHKRTHDVATSAIAKAQQLEANADHQEDAEALPHGVEPSSSPLDFFANCRQSKLKEMFVEQSNRQNTYRAIAVAKRWPEFATKRSDGSGVFMTKDDMTTALTAHLGRTPHRQTVARVWENLLELGGRDLREKTRQVGRRQEPTQIIEMGIDTAEGLREKRYVGLDLLDGTDRKTTTGGVTPVVTGEPAQAL
ncbi:hypothetical protein [Haloarcula pelagica]|uniref:hypothetical protein n=1 Tax=Haloarcula pelagica TaxID=3033389 RepID=UPI0024C32CA5|nr:hypothetical protein [Halomicroarcula sp. YJ-61-S]